MQFQNGSITRRNVSIKLLPGNVDFEVEEKFETINSSSSSPPLTPVTPLSPKGQTSSMVQEETATVKRNKNSFATSSTSSAVSTTESTSATSYSTSLTSSGTTSSISQSTNNRLESIGEIEIILNSNITWFAWYFITNPVLQIAHSVDWVTGDQPVKFSFRFEWIWRNAANRRRGRRHLGGLGCSVSRYSKYYKEFQFLSIKWFTEMFGPKMSANMKT